MKVKRWGERRDRAKSSRKNRTGIKLFGVRVIMIPVVLGMLVSVVLPAISYFGYDAMAALGNMTLDEINGLGGSIPASVERYLAAATLIACVDNTADKTPMLTSDTRIKSALYEMNLFVRNATGWNQIYASATAQMLNITGQNGGGLACAQGQADSINVKTLLSKIDSNYVDNIICKSGSQVFDKRAAGLVVNDNLTLTDCKNAIDGTLYLSNPKLERLGINLNNLKSNLSSYAVRPTDTKSLYWIYYYSALSNGKKCIDHIGKSSGSKSYGTAQQVADAIKAGNTFDGVYYFAGNFAGTDNLYGTVGLTNLNPGFTTYTAFPSKSQATNSDGNECSNMLVKLRVNISMFDATSTAGDRDRDGVLDFDDLCPDEPGKKEKEGCPDDVTIETRNGNKIITHLDGTVTVQCWDRSVVDDESKCPPRTSGGSSGPQCDGGGFTWILCPPVEEGNSVLGRLLADLMENQLKINIFNNDEASGKIREIWGSVLGIANLAFVVVFLFVIYSSATSVGLKNYDIKKILPRLIVTVILVNTSFYICAAINDIVNIVGAGAYTLLSGLGGGATESPISHVASGLVVGLAVVVLALFFLGTALLAILGFIAALAFRQVLVVVLIVISPLAFVAWLLPNTEKWFKSWWTNFTKLLFVYPIIMAVFGATRVLEYISFQATSASADGGMDSVITWVMQVVIWGVIQIAPILALAPVMKMGGGLMGKIQGGVNKVKGAKPLQDIKKSTDLRARAATRTGFTNMANRLPGGQSNMYAKGAVKYDAGKKKYYTTTMTTKGREKKHYLNDRREGRLESAITGGDAANVLQYRKQRNDVRAQEIVIASHSEDIKSIKEAAGGEANLTQAERGTIATHEQAIRDANRRRSRALNSIENMAEGSDIIRKKRQGGLLVGVAGEGEEKGHDGIIRAGLNAIAGAGVGAGLKKAEALEKNAQEGTKASQDIHDFEIDMKHNARAFKSELENQKYELKIKGTDESIQHAAQMMVEKAKVETGRGGIDFRTKEAALGIAPYNPNISEAFNSAQSTLTKENMALLENSARMAVQNGESTEGFEAMMLRLANGENVDIPESMRQAMKQNGMDLGGRTSISMSDMGSYSPELNKVIMGSIASRIPNITTMGVSAKLDASGNPTQDNTVTADGIIAMRDRLNTIQTSGANGTANTIVAAQQALENQFNAVITQMAQRGASQDEMQRARSEWDSRRITPGSTTPAPTAVPPQPPIAPPPPVP